MADRDVVDRCPRDAASVLADLEAATRAEGLGEGHHRRLVVAGAGQQLVREQTAGSPGRSRRRDHEGILRGIGRWMDIEQLSDGQVGNGSKTGVGNDQAFWFGDLTELRPLRLGKLG